MFKRKTPAQATEEVGEAVRRASGGILRFIGIGIGALLALIVALDGFYTVDQGERGVVLRNGALHSVADPGLHFKLPVFDAVVVMSVRTEKLIYPEVSAYSSDIQAADLVISVNHRIAADRVASVYERFGVNYMDRIVTPMVNKKTKEIFGMYTAAKSVSERAELGARIEAAIRDSVVDDGISIASVQIENIDFSSAYEKAIEQAMQAEAEVKKVRQELERERVEAEKKIVAAQALRESTIQRATGEAEAIRLRGEAEAKAIRARGTALRDNPALVDLVKAEKWDGKLPTTMLPSGTVPFMDVKK